jgi:hypothetical protein
VAVAEQLTVFPHPEQVDGGLLGLFEAPGPAVGQNELTASAPPSEGAVCYFCFVLCPCLLITFAALMCQRSMHQVEARHPLPLSLSAHVTVVIRAPQV